MLNNIINMVMSGAINNSPAMQEFNRLMGGKTQAQQFQTLINIAKNKGFDINEKRFNAEDLRKLGIKLP
ncbi:MAG: hypothetical protein MJ211_10140 [Bacteroidales bacterium]|nr:hypothetical protein [Bacteroidales bacterium]